MTLTRLLSDEEYMNRTRSTLPASPPARGRVADRFKRLRGNKGEFAIFLGACFVIVALLTYNFFGLINVFSSQKSLGFDSITANAGYVANTDHMLHLALFSFDREVNATGISTTTVLSPKGTVLSSILAPGGNLDIISNDAGFSHYIQFRSIQYRKINLSQTSETSIFDTPSAETWTSDMGQYNTLMLDYKNIINPSLLLSTLLPTLGVETSEKKSDGSIFVSLSGSLASVPKILLDLVPKGSLGFPGARLRVYATLDKGRNLQRVLIVFPDTSSILVSSNGKATRAIDKPDLTRVVPNLKIKAKTKRR